MHRYAYTPRYLYDVAAAVSTMNGLCVFFGNSPLGLRCADISVINAFFRAP